MGVANTNSVETHHLEHIIINHTVPHELANSNSLVMAWSTSVLTVALALVPSPGQPLLTCPGFPGYCSESFPGQSCNVVCDFGRNNVPLCQEDGTWTDIPRCIEHDPGVDEQIPGTCPSIPGYCAQGFLNTRCKFDCTTGPDIDSLCSVDGTWDPYPTCLGDLRETRDGCDGCPGPVGGKRNRTAEAILSRNTASDRRVPKIISNNGDRKSVPSFAGNINIGRIESNDNRFSQGRPSPVRTTTPTPSFNSFQNQQPRQQQNQFGGQPRRQQQFQQNQPRFQQNQFQQHQPVPAQQQPNTFNPNGVKTQSLFDQIKARINREKELKKQIMAQQETKQQAPAVRQPQPQPQPSSFQQPQPQPRPQPSFTAQPQNFGTFGVFEAVDLSSGPNPSALPPAAPTRSLESRQSSQNEGFFGVFPEVNLQG